MNSIYCTGTSSSAHTYGNVASLIREYVLDLFPKNYFKYTHITSEIVSRDLKRDRMNNKDIVKHDRPALIIRPSFSSLDDDDKFLNDTYLINGTSKFNGSISRNMLDKITFDTDNGISLKYFLNRDKLEFDVSIVVNTLFNQLDIRKDLINRVNWEAPWLYESSLESMIPRQMIALMARIVNIDMENDPSIMLQYLNSTSRFPITYKMRNSSSKDEYFMYYTVNILLNFSNIDISDANKKNMVDDYYTINFKVTAEFNIPGGFYLVGIPRADIQEKIVIDNDSENHEFTPIFTVKDLLYNGKANGILDHNFKLLCTSIFKTDKLRDMRSDNLTFGQLIPNPIVDMVRDHLGKGIPIETFIRMCVSKDQDIIFEDKDYKVDWLNMSLTILDSDYSSTYRLSIFINESYINSRLGQFIEKHKTDFDPGTIDGTREF